MARSGTICRQCGQNNPPGMSFCRACGGSLHKRSASGSGVARMPSAAEVVGRSRSSAAASAVAGKITCQHCGAQTPEGYRFCQQCGQSLASGEREIAQANTDPAEAGKRTPVPAVKSRPPGVRSVPPGVRSAPPEAVAAVNVDASAATLSASGDAAQSLVKQAEEIARRRTIEEDPAVQTTLPETPVERIGHTPPPQPAVSESGRVAATTAPWGRLITVNQDGTDGRGYPLAAEVVEIGRFGYGLRFDKDRYLAATHARLDRKGSKTYVVPLDRVNGTFRRLRRPVELGHGDSILLGRELLRFDPVDPDERAAESLVQGGVARLGSPPREPWGRLVALLPNLGERDVRYLNIPEVVIGREDGHIVFNDDEFLSRRHAILRWTGTVCTLEDLGSSNGSYVRLRGSTELEHLDYLRLGNQLFRYEAI